MEKKLKIEQACPLCQGTGHLSDAVCPDCQGAGTLLTDEGKVIVNYLKDCIRLSEN